LGFYDLAVLKVSAEVVQYHLLTGNKLIVEMDLPFLAKKWQVHITI
jgi:hypothetical protein